MIRLLATRLVEQIATALAWLGEEQEAKAHMAGL